MVKKIDLGDVMGSLPIRDCTSCDQPVTDHADDCALQAEVRAHMKRSPVFKAYQILQLAIIKSATEIELVACQIMTVMHPNCPGSTAEISKAAAVIAQQGIRWTPLAILEEWYMQASAGKAWDELQPRPGGGDA